MNDWRVQFYNCFVHSLTENIRNFLKEYSGGYRQSPQCYGLPAGAQALRHKQWLYKIGGNSLEGVDTSKGHIVVVTDFVSIYVQRMSGVAAHRLDTTSDGNLILFNPRLDHLTVSIRYIPHPVLQHTQPESLIEEQAAPA